MISATDYFEQHHLRDILDHFVCLYVRGQSPGRATLPAALTNPNAKDDASTAAAAASNDVHPQVQVITALRTFLQNMRAERRNWQANHRYIILLPAHGMHETHATAIREFADSLCTTLGSVAMLLSPAGRLGTQQHHFDKEQQTRKPSEVASTNAVTAHAKVNVREEEIAQDEEGEQKRVDRFRAATIAQLSRLLHYTPYAQPESTEKDSTNCESNCAQVCGIVLLAQEWPSAIADALLLEDLLGAPQCVVHLVNGKHNDNGNSVNESQETITETTKMMDVKTGRVKVQEIQREAGFTSARRERRALLSYYRARNVLREIDVGADATSLTREGALAKELHAMLRPSL